MDTNLVDPDLIPGLEGPPHALFDAWRQSDPVHWNPPNENHRSPLPDGHLDQGILGVDALSRSVRGFQKPRPFFLP